MELLTPLLEWEKKHPLQEDDIIRLGCDICRALELCHNNKIIHRDIKPQNIFVNKNGDFKLGDFGMTRIAKRTANVIPVKGACFYAAPEVYKEMKYDRTIDIYSLGLVLYRYLNNNRSPFLPTGSANFEDRQIALYRRLSGEEVPEPANGSEKLKKAVLMTLQYDPEKRIQSAAALRNILEQCQKNDQCGWECVMRLPPGAPLESFIDQKYVSEDNEKAFSKQMEHSDEIENKLYEDEATVRVNSLKPLVQPKKKNETGIIVVVIAVVVVILLGISVTTKKTYQSESSANSTIDMSTSTQETNDVQRSETKKPNSLVDMEKDSFVEENQVVETDISIRVILSRSPDDQVYKNTWDAFTETCKERGYDCSYYWISNVTAVTDQVMIFNSVVESADCDIILFEPVDDYAFMDVFEKANDAGIYVVAMHESEEFYDASNATLTSISDRDYEMWESTLNIILGEIRK